MKLKVIVHEAEEGGYWAEVPAVPGCATQIKFAAIRTALWILLLAGLVSGQGNRIDISTSGDSPNLKSLY